MEPSGYKVSAIAFSNGEPVAESTSTTGYVDVVSNADNSKCPDDCFRPVGLAFDSQGRLFFSSDSTGEIYMITGESSNGANGTVDGAPIPSATATGAGMSSTSTPATGGNTAISTHSVGTYLLYAWLGAIAVAGFLL